MKVLQVIDALDVGGAERILVMLSNLLYKNGQDVTVLVLTRKGELAAQLHPDIKILELNRTKRFDKVKMKELGEIMTKFQIVHAHLKHNFRYVALVKKRFGIKGLKIVFHDHSHNLGVSKLSAKYAKDWLFKNMLKPKYYIGVSPENCAWAQNDLGVNEERCFLLENVVEREQISEKNRNRQGMVVVSNITPVKNIAFAVQLAKRLNDTLTVYGRVNDPVYFEELQDEIAKLNMTKKVLFIHDCNNVQRELYNYKIGIHTSHKETGPLVLIEFMAQGLPFVSHATGAVFEKLREVLPLAFVTGFDEEIWVRNISEMQQFPSSTIEKLYLEHYSSKNYYDQCLAIYQTILRS